VTERDNQVRLVADHARGVRVSLNGRPLPRLAPSEFEAAPRGWTNAGENLIVAKSGKLNVALAKTFEFVTEAVPPEASVFLVCENAVTAPGDEVYAVGSGTWKLDPSVAWEYITNPPPATQCDPSQRPGPRAPIHTRLVTGLAAGTNLEWKCARKRASGEWDVQTGAPNAIPLKAGFSGTSRGSF
jgi:alpha-glucosidase